MAEKRHFKRVSTALETRYTKSQGPATVSSLSNTKDISRNGLCAKLSKVVNKKDTILMEIRFADKERIAVLAKVIWLKPNPGNHSNICGLKFLWISSRTMLRKAVSKKEIKGAA